MVDGPTAGGTHSGTPSGYDRASDRQEYYTVSEAAKILGISARRVRQIAQDGKVDGVRTDDGWKLFRYSVHGFRDHRADQAPSRGAREQSSEAREWMERVHTLERELGRLEGRLELTERTESTMREERQRLLEDLDRERERAAQEQARTEEVQRDAEQSIREREEAEEEARRLREELEAERSKGFWRRLFGG
jgi:excisionase family DNA binding protein